MNYYYTITIRRTTPWRRTDSYERYYFNEYMFNKAIERLKKDKQDFLVTTHKITI